MMKTITRPPEISSVADREAVLDQIVAALAARGYPNPNETEHEFPNDYTLYWFTDKKEPIPPELADTKLLEKTITSLIPWSLVSVNTYDYSSEWKVNLNIFGKNDTPLDPPPTPTPLVSGNIIYMVTKGSYSDFDIEGVLQGPAGIDLQAEVDCFQRYTGADEYNMCFEFFRKWLTSHKPEMSYVIVETVHLG